MRRCVTRVLILAVVAVLLVGAGAMVAANRDSARAAGEEARAMTGNFDIVTHGSGWVPELRNKFSMFKAMGWGTVAKVKAAGVGDQWVHLPLTVMSVAEGTAPNLTYVEFCAKSSNGAATMPIQMDVWDNSTRISTDPVTWPADNAYHCVGHTYAVPTWRTDLGISVKIHFANTTDSVTLYKGWARIAP
jgi:hypothetical protein